MVENIISDSFQPDLYYPTIKELEMYFNSELKDYATESDKIHFYLWLVLYGFKTDDFWHEMFPGHEENNVENNLKYLFTPVYSDEGSHTNIWFNSDSQDIRDDKEASFEYMQEILMDREYFRIKEESIDDELYHEIMVKTKYKDLVNNIQEHKDKLVFFLKKKYSNEPVYIKNWKSAYIYFKTEQYLSPADET